jgi:molybdopterin converting factor small subunit
MKKISISVYATLRKRRSDMTNRGPVSTKATTIGELLDEMHITKVEAAMLFVNYKRATLESEVRDGDKVNIFPIPGGWIVFSIIKIRNLFRLGL